MSAEGNASFGFLPEGTPRLTTNSRRTLRSRIAPALVKLQGLRQVIGLSSYTRAGKAALLRAKRDGAQSLEPWANAARLERETSGSADLDQLGRWRNRVNKRCRPGWQPAQTRKEGRVDANVEELLGNCVPLCHSHYAALYCQWITCFVHCAPEISLALIGLLHPAAAIHQAITGPHPSRFLAHQKRGARNDSSEHHRQETPALS